MLSFLRASDCQLDSRFVCRRCGRKYTHENVISSCSEGTDVKGIVPISRAVVYNPKLAIVRETKFCAGCPLFLADRGTEAPICVLLACGCGQNATPEEKASKLEKNWTNHLANTVSRCLLPKNPKWGTMEEMHAQWVDLELNTDPSPPPDEAP
jgi:hypothetical protein